MSGCLHYGRCRRDPFTGEVLCTQGWRDACPMDGVEADEDGILNRTDDGNNGNARDGEESEE